MNILVMLGVVYLMLHTIRVLLTPTQSSVEKESLEESEDEDLAMLFGAGPVFFDMW